MGKVSHLNLRDDEPTAFDGITMAGGFRGEPMDVWGRILTGYVVLPEGVPERPWRMLPKTYHSN